MPLNAIKTALFTHLESLSLGVTIHYPNVASDLPDGEFVIPTVLPATTRSLGLVATNQELGLLQVSVFVKKGVGEIRSAEIAEAILAGFPRNLDLFEVRIDEAGSVGASFYDGSWQITPVTIPYQHIS